MSASTYERLCAPFEYTFTDVRGGVEVTFVSGEQVISRLNEVLGVFGWSFRVLDKEIHAESDEAWVLGELEATIDGQRVVRQQFGSQKIKRQRSTGAPLDIGFDWKGAGTDCLKKCATTIGVALYLSEKHPAQRQAPRQQQRQERTASQPTPIRQAAVFCQHPTGERDEHDRLLKCGKPLEPVPNKFATAEDLAKASWQLTRYPMCWGCFQVEEGKTTKTG